MFESKKKASRGKTASKKVVDEAELDTPDQLTEKALAEAADTKPPETEEESVAEEVMPALKDTSLITVSGSGMGRRTMRRCDYDEMIARENAETEVDESGESDG